MDSLKITDKLPKGLKDLCAKNILDFFPTPTLVEIDQQKESWVLISFLLHGNETTGLDVLAHLDEVLKNQRPSKNIALLVGNVRACAASKRQLEGQEDFNRLWSTESSHPIVKSLTNWISNKKIFATIDVHNNSGKNPLYACITNLDDPSIYLASLFSKSIVYFETPKNVFSRYFSEYAPSVTLECGTPSNPQGIKKAIEYIHDILNLQSIEVSNPKHLDVNIYQTKVKIKIPETINVQFGEEIGELTFPENVDELNFRELVPGDQLALTSHSKIPFMVLDDKDKDLTDAYFKIVDKKIVLDTKVIPSMFTKNIEVMKSDCFGYLMEEINKSL